MTAAIYFHPDGYTTSGPKLMGRNAAGESFLRGYFAHGSGAEVWARVEEAAHAQALEQFARDAGCGKPIKLIGRETPGALSQPGTLYYPGPDIANRHGSVRSSGMAGGACAASRTPRRRRARWMPSPNGSPPRCSRGTR